MCKNPDLFILSCWNTFNKSTTSWIYPFSPDEFPPRKFTEVLSPQQTGAAGLVPSTSWKRNSGLGRSPGCWTTGLPSFESNLYICEDSWVVGLLIWRWLLSALPSSLSLGSSISLLLIGSNKISPDTWAVVASASNPLIPLDTRESLVCYSTTTFCKCCTPPWYTKSMLPGDQRHPCPLSRFQHASGSLHSIPGMADEILKMSPSKAKSLWKLNSFSHRWQVLILCWNNQHKACPERLKGSPRLLQEGWQLSLASGLSYVMLGICTITTNYLYLNEKKIWF